MTAPRMILLPLCAALALGGFGIGMGGLGFNAGAAFADSATGAIDARVFKVLAAAQRLAQASRFDEAIQRLDAAGDNRALQKSGYARGQLWNLYAYIYARQEQYRKAIAAYEKVIAEADAPQGLKLQAGYSLAQLYLQLEDYPAAIEFMREWLATVERPTATAYIVLAQAYYHTEAREQALAALEMAMQTRRESGGEIAENWLRLKATLHYEQNDPESALATYRQLFERYPRLEDLKQIAALHGALGQDRQRLAAYDAAHVQGGLTSEVEVLNLAYMYLGISAPYKAGRIIEQGIADGVIERTRENAETLANIWAQASEHKKAVPALRQAAEASDNGALHARLAGVYFDAGDYQNAAIAARAAAAKGGLKQPGGNQVLLGMALFNTRQYEDAIQAFRRAKKSKRYLEDAAAWERYILRELERRRFS